MKNLKETVLLRHTNPELYDALLDAEAAVRHVGSCTRTMLWAIMIASGSTILRKIPDLPSIDEAAVVAVIGSVAGFLGHAFMRSRAIRKVRGVYDQDADETQKMLVREYRAHRNGRDTVTMQNILDIAYQSSIDPDLLVYEAEEV